MRGLLVPRGQEKGDRDVAAPGSSRRTASRARDALRQGADAAGRGHRAFRLGLAAHHGGHLAHDHRRGGLPGPDHYAPRDRLADRLIEYTLPTSERSRMSSM